MANIKFYAFNKKPNSTKVPDESGAINFVCRIKDESSIINPIIELHDMVESFTTAYNYCYIDEFKRYYFIDDKIRNQNVWTIYAHCDVFASFKSSILNSIQYVIRSSSAYDGSIIDNLYLNKFNTDGFNARAVRYSGYTDAYGDFLADSVRCYDSTGNNERVAPIFNMGINDGYFVLGITGRDNATGTSFYVMDYTVFKTFINKAFTLNPSDMSDVSSGIANAIYDPLSYITMCKWYPHVRYDVLDIVTDIYVGRYKIDTFGTAYELPAMSTARYSFDITIPKHRDSSSRKYLNVAPFSEISLYFEPFGIIPIDSTKVIDESELHVEFDVDYTNGIASLKVNQKAGLPLQNPIIASGTADYGVTIPISTLAYDWKGGLIMSGMQAVKEIVTSSSMSSGMKPAYMPDSAWEQRQGYVQDHRSQNMDILNSALDIAGSALGQLQTVGTVGSFLSFNSGAPMLYVWFIDQTEYDDARFGRPLYQKRRLSSLSGMCVCLNATIDTFYNPRPLKPEEDAILSGLNGGVYLE